MKTRNAFNLLLAAATSAALPTATLAATPEVTSVAMAQSSMSRLVTITYTLANAPAVVTLDVQTNANTSAAASDPGWTSIGGEAVCNAQGDVWKKVAPELTEGNSFNGTITWRPDLSWPDHKIASGGARAVVTAWALDNTPDYMVVDVSEGAQPNTQKYYPSVEFLPGGILSNQNYRTTKLVMRKIMAKDVEWTMGSTSMESQRETAREATHQVTLTNNYYIGVFEITQTQWSLIQPDRLRPSQYNNVADRAMRPVEQVCYNEIRNAANSATANTTYDWPHAPNPGSFLGKLRTKTGINDFDLPSDAQWEFAARAGNGDTRWGDGSAVLNTDYDANLNKLGRYQQNGGFVWNGSGFVGPAYDCGATNGTAIVGTYLPNNWGIYDMHGNVYEWCLDWYQADIATVQDASGNYYNGRVNIDPSNSQAYLSGASASSGNRVLRGGWAGEKAFRCRSAFRSQSSPQTQGGYLGFRVICTAGLR